MHAHREVTGQSDAIRKVLRQVEQVAPTDSTVLVRGETGSGKELVAQAIHQLSQRKGQVMVKVNCAALPSGLVESELFGREKGAYTGAMTRQIGRFEVADRSTLFLDEVGELSLEVQAKLLRVLETGEFERLGSPKTIKVDVRLIAATNRDLLEEIKKGRFREDLYYRLNVFPIRVPPLRERAGRHPGAGLGLPRGVLAPAWARRSPRSRARRWRRSSAIPGRATCASCGTWSSTARSSPPATRSRCRCSTTSRWSRRPRRRGRRSPTPSAT